MDLTVAMKSSKGTLFTMAMSFNNKGPFGGFYRYIGEEDTYKVYRDSMTDSEGKDVLLDGVPAFDLQDVEFTSAIREGRQPESSAASCLPTMALLDRNMSSRHLTAVAFLNANTAVRATAIVETQWRAAERISFPAIQKQLAVFFDRIEKGVVDPQPTLPIMPK